MKAPRRQKRRRLHFEELEPRALLSGDPLLNALPLEFQAGRAVAYREASRETGWYAFTITQDSRITAHVTASQGDTRLSLLTSQGAILLQNDAVALDNPDDHIDLHLPGAASGTTYLLAIEALGGLEAAAMLTVDAAPANPPGRPPSVGLDSWSVEAGDLNRDGIVDVVTANWVSNDVSVLLGRGDGTFAPEVRYTAGTSPNDVRLVDLDGDDDLDLVVANFEGESLSIRLGAGDGTFGPEQRLEVGGVPAAVGTGDFNDDGRLDLAFADFAGSSIVVLLRQADGSYSASPGVAVGESPYDLTVGDFNGDQILDIATADYTSSTVTVLLGQGTGSFRRAGTYAAGEAPYAIVTVDLDGDGRLDLVTGNTNGGNVSVLLGQGDGTFTVTATLTAGAGVDAVAVADFNDDGRLDLAVANTYDGTLSVFTGLEDHAFSSQSSLAVGANPISLITVDVNHDGHADLVYGNLSSGTVGVALGRGDGTFLLLDQVGGSTRVDNIATADLNQDGRLDLVAVNYGTGDARVMLGRGDGTFQVLGRYFNGSDPAAVAVGDFTGDGLPDLVLGNYSTNDISLSVGQGDGTFAEPVFFATGNIPISLVTGDFNGDGQLDLATANTGSNDVSVLLGTGEGTFAPARSFAVGRGPVFLSSGDYNQDDILDLATVNSQSGTLSVLFGLGDGTFAPALTVAAGTDPRCVASGDLDGDGSDDLAVSLFGADQVLVFLSRPTSPARLADPVVYQTGPQPYQLVSGDFNGDQILDLAVSNREGRSLTLLLGAGDGTFQPGQSHNPGIMPGALVAGDLNGDSRLDLAVASFNASEVAVFLNQADTLFTQSRRTSLAAGREDVAAADFNGDGFLDVVSANLAEGTVSIRLGQGDLTFGVATNLAVGTDPAAVATGDFNRDGRPDLAVAALAEDAVTIFLGNGDGSLRCSTNLPVGLRPVALAAADLNQDGVLDLVTANYDSGDVSVLFGRSDGLFASQVRYQVGAGPLAVAAADVNGDGLLDLIVGNALSRDVSILLGRQDGTFNSGATVNLTAGATALTLSDLDHDGRLDLAVVSEAADRIFLFQGLAGGTFAPWSELAAGVGPMSLSAGDFNRDGHVDLTVASSNTSSVLTWLGQGDGTFVSPSSFDVGQFPLALLTVDLDRDGRLDVLTLNNLGEPLSVGAGRGDGTFAPADKVFRPFRFTPLVADLNGDGLSDVAILRQDGAILVRLGRGVGDFHAPVIINPEPADAVRDVTLLAADGRSFLITLEVSGDTLSVYSWAPDGTFFRLNRMPVTASLPSRLVAGDVNGDGLEDIVVLANGSSEVLIGLQQPGGTGMVVQRLAVGANPSDIALLDVDDQHGVDVVVADQFSGEIRVFLNDPVSPFTATRHYRSGTGLYSVVDLEGEPVLSSREMPVALAAVLADAHAGMDLIAVNSGSNRVNVLLDNRRGGLLNPEPRLSLPTGNRPIAAVAGQFNVDAYMDIAVLNADSADLSVFLGNAEGGFDVLTGPDGEPLRFSAGNRPGGLAANDINSDGQLDLLVGNSFGDLLILLGNGDGTFQEYRRIDARMTLTVADLDGDGQDDFVFANRSLDRVTVYYSGDGQTFTQDRTQGILHPGQVNLTDLNGDGRRDLVVVNTGGNSVLAYLGLPGGSFAEARSFFAGTSPVGLSLDDLNGDGRVDLVVANHGSNDVSVLLSRGQGDDWTLMPGPRLHTGIGPVATVVRDINGDSIADLLVSNSGSNSVSLLTGLGRGFFDDRNPTIYQTGRLPEMLLVGQFDSRPGLDLVTFDIGVGALSFFSGMQAQRRELSGAVDPVGFLTGDFNGDGLDDLVLASHLDNQVSLWLGGDEGLRRVAALSGPAGFHPGDIALARLTSDSLDIWMTADSQEMVIQLSFALDFGPVTGVPGLELTPVLSRQEITLGQPVSDFSSLGRSLAETVTTLLLVHESGETKSEIVLAGREIEEEFEAPPPAGSGEEDEGADREAVALVNEDATTAGNEVTLNAFVVGVEELPFESRLLEKSEPREEPEGIEDEIDLELLDVVFQMAEPGTPALEELFRKAEPPEATQPQEWRWSPASWLMLAALGVPIAGWRCAEERVQRRVRANRLWRHNDERPA